MTPLTPPTDKMAEPTPEKLSPVVDDETSSTQSEGSEALGNSFEGPEKNLEIDFKVGVGHPRGFRCVERSDLDAMLEAAQCQILSRTSNEHIDAYVLSESSMFVYAHKVVLKTCGTTTLLKCLPFIQRFAETLELEIEWVSYSRKNYTFPEEQKYPHTSFQTEVAFLSSYFPDGSAHVLGPLNHDHWYIYAWDAEIHEAPDSSVSSEDEPQQIWKEPAANESTLHVLMQDMDPEVAKQFFKDAQPDMTSRRMTVESGIRDLVPGAVIDDFAFDPCGYSMNGILFDAYYTIHITPESHCSYVSFETNARLRSYESLLKNVIRCFRPAKYSVSVYTDRNALEAANSAGLVFARDLVKMDDGLVYKRKGGHTQATFEGEYMCRMANFARADKRPNTLSRAAHKHRSPSFA